MEYYNHKCLRALGNRISKTTKIDYTTQEKSRGCPKKELQGDNAIKGNQIDVARTNVHNIEARYEYGH